MGVCVCGGCGPAMRTGSLSSLERHDAAQCREPQSKRSLGFASRLSIGRPSAVPGRRKKRAICREERRRHVEMQQGDSRGVRAEFLASRSARYTHRQVQWANRMTALSLVVRALHACRHARSPRCYRRPVSQPSHTPRVRQKSDSSLTQQQGSAPLPWAACHGGYTIAPHALPVA